MLAHTIDVDPRTIADGDSSCLARSLVDAVCTGCHDHTELEVMGDMRRWDFGG